jgi:hypothetical protein
MKEDLVKGGKEEKRGPERNRKEWIFDLYKMCILILSLYILLIKLISWPYSRPGTYHNCIKGTYMFRI